ncbi:unnamed protein product, partial [Sphacelaria rigidula]
ADGVTVPPRRLFDLATLSSWKYHSNTERRFHGELRAWSPLVQYPARKSVVVQKELESYLHLLCAAARWLFLFFSRFGKKRSPGLFEATVTTEISPPDESAAPIPKY